MEIAIWAVALILGVFALIAIVDICSEIFDKSPRWTNPKAPSK